MISNVYLVSSGLKRWRDPAMVRRWVGTVMIGAQTLLPPAQGLQGHDATRKVIRAEVELRLAEEERWAVEATKCDRAAA